MTKQNTDVLIVGAGPVGLFCANELTRHGMTYRIIDKKSGITDKSKALGIHIRSLDVFEDTGFIEEILKQGHPIEGILFKNKGEIIFDATLNYLHTSYHYMIDLPQSKTEAILYQGLLDKGFTVEWDTELTHLNDSTNEIIATIKKPNNKIELLHANWLIACDGSHSTVRHELNAEFKGALYPKVWWLADLMLDWSLIDARMVIYVDPQGPLACFPMGEGRYRLVMTVPKKLDRDLTLDDIKQVFDARSSDAAILSNPIWLNQFSISHRQVQHYRHNRVFFAGDSAHIHSPIGGQGLNTGIQDAYNLVWKLALVDKDKADCSLLDSYHAERFPVGHEVIKRTDLATRMMLWSNPILISLRNFFIKIATAFTYFKLKLARQIAELAISYKNSPIVYGLGHAKRLKLGEFTPTFTLLNTTTDLLVTSNIIIQGTFHHVFIFCGLKEKGLEETLQVALNLAEKYADTVKVHLVSAEKISSPSPKITYWIDKKREVHDYFAFKKPALLLVRPDKYVGMIQTPLNEKDFVDHFYLRPLK